MQARMDYIWENTVRKKTIRHENYPFDLRFVNKVEVVSDIVSEGFVNVSKIYGDYKNITFKNCNYVLHRGQYIEYKEGYQTDYYMTYEGTEELNTTAKAKIVRCNNRLNWYDEEGKIQSYPCLITTELSGTQIKTDDLINTSQGRLVCMVQANENTIKIKANMRFPISHTQVFKVNNVDVSRLLNVNEDVSDILKFYIQFVPQLDTDNMEENISVMNFGGDKVTTDLISPTFNSVSQYMEQEFVVGKTGDIITYATNWQDEQKYKLSNIDNKFKLECFEPSDDKLEITFDINGTKNIIQVDLIKFV